MSRTCIHTLPCVLQLQTLPLYQGRLRRCHVSYASGHRYLIEVGSSAVTCPVAPDLASWVRWAPALPHVSRLQTPLLCWCRLWRRHVSSGSGPRLPTEVGSGATTCPEAPDIASHLGWAPRSPRVLRLRTSPPYRGGFRCCHVLCGSQWVADLKNKERHSRYTYAARLAYLQRALACFQGAWHQSHHALQYVRVGGTVMTYKMCEQTATVLRRACWPLTRHNYNAEWSDRIVSYR
jgi:hypothetical protein